MADGSSSDNQNAATVERIKSRSLIVAALITALSGLAGSVINNILASRKIDGLNQKLSTSATEADNLKRDLTQTKSEQDALYRLTAQRLESDFLVTSAKAVAAAPIGLPESELNYRRLRRAVFLNISVLRANPTILEKTLNFIVKEGFPWVAPHLGRILSDFTEIKTVRLRWIEDSAIPMLQRAIEASSRSPMQTTPSAQVPIPDSIRIIDGNGGVITVVDLYALKQEAELIRQTISP